MADPTDIAQHLSDVGLDLQIAARLGHIIDQSIHEIYLFKAQTYALTRVNRSAADNLGYSFDELQAMRVSDIAPEFDACWARDLLTALQSGETDRAVFDLVHRRKDGTEYPVKVALYFDPVSPGHEFWAIAEDVTEHNRVLDAVQQAQKLEAASQLANGVVHDINNVLSIIEGNLELLEMRHDNAETRELLQEARDAARLGRNLSERLISHSRPAEADLQPLDINKQLLGMEGFLRRVLGEGISLCLRLAPGLWLTRIDVTQFESSLVNLLLNARDAMLGEGRLQIDTAQCTLTEPAAAKVDLPPGDYVALSVADTGGGIASDLLTRVFEPDFTTKSSPGGRGLGLSMVQGFARQHQGAATVDSEAGKGACFTLYLPRLPDLVRRDDQVGKQR